MITAPSISDLLTQLSTALYIARRVGPGGHVLATDISEAMLRLAHDNARQAGLRQVETRVSDAEDLKVEAASFDAAVCRLGLIGMNPGIGGSFQHHFIGRVTQLRTPFIAMNIRASRAFLLCAKGLFHA